MIKFIFFVRKILLSLIAIAVFPFLIIIALPIALLIDLILEFPKFFMVLEILNMIKDIATGKLFLDIFKGDFI